MTESGKHDLDRDDYKVIFRKSIRTKSGKVLIAAHYGLSAFPIRVRKGSSAQGDLFD